MSNRKRRRGDRKKEKIRQVGSNRKGAKGRERERQRERERERERGEKKTMRKGKR
jgi:hypothetical protein